MNNSGRFQEFEVAMIDCTSNGQLIRSFVILADGRILYDDEAREFVAEQEKGQP